jgi:hypothetical protein
MVPTALNVFGGLCWCLMTLAFLVTRSHVRVFCLICGLLLGSMGWMAVSSAGAGHRADATALMTGLVLYFAGLLIVRAMLIRSVSLQLLISHGLEQQDAAFDERVASRIEEAVRYGLVRPQDGRYALSGPGRVLAAVLAGLYRLANLS